VGKRKVNEERLPRSHTMHRFSTSPNVVNFACRYQKNRPFSAESSHAPFFARKNSWLLLIPAKFGPVEKQLRRKPRRASGNLLQLKFSDFPPVKFPLARSLHRSAFIYAQPGYLSEGRSNS
jgi:hypothetical protein